MDHAKKYIQPITIEMMSMA